MILISKIFLITIRCNYLTNFTCFTLRLPDGFCWYITNSFNFISSFYSFNNFYVKFSLQNNSQKVRICNFFWLRESLEQNLLLGIKAFE